MPDTDRKRIGFACAYTPIALIDAAGFAPYRLIPAGDWPDQAGRLLHDNLCPHVKRILDRAIQGDLPALAGLVLVNSCDAMRRLADAWSALRPDDGIVLLDLPVSDDGKAVDFFSRELSKLARVLSRWGGCDLDATGIHVSISRYNRCSDLFEALRSGARGSAEGSVVLQRMYNRAMTEPLDGVILSLEQMLAPGTEDFESRGRHADESVTPPRDPGPVPLFLFGNILPDPEAFALFGSCGARIADEDLCTGSRLFSPIDTCASRDATLPDALANLARGMLSRPRCARTFSASRPCNLALDVLERAKACGARGVVCHTLKFCDPYLTRLPAVRDVLREAGIPLLVLEGDCTMRSLGQHRTRIEAFVEMLDSG